MFLLYIFLFRYSFTFQINLNCIENLSVAIVGLQTNSSMPTHPDWHTPNGAVLSYYTLVVFLSAYFEHKRLVTPLKSLSHISNLS